MAVSAANGGVMVAGDKAAVDWAGGVVKALQGQLGGEAGSLPPVGSTW